VLAALLTIAWLLLLLPLLLVSPGIQPRQIGCVIVNSSLFNPTPSLSACIMNHFKMGSKTINYNLGGMGCSASLVAIDLAKQVRLVEGRGARRGCGVKPFSRGAAGCDLVKRVYACLRLVHGNVANLVAAVVW
jgi:hypothetical protein